MDLLYLVRFNFLDYTLIQSVRYRHRLNAKYLDLDFRLQVKVEALGSYSNSPPTLIITGAALLC
jgi:hypothetical protein